VTRRDSARVPRGTRRNPPTRRPAGAMAAVIAYARSQVGKRYASGGEGPYSFDCSGFTKRAYARAGLSLRHSSLAQAARARIISRAEALPGDLVVGPGHVGVYMGGGMMIDAGNERTGVIYRRLYAGLHVERF
jgi:cell wall-associated NlpC family hydrolase